MLPKPRSKYGYNEKEIEKICKKRSIPLWIFWDKFGVCTIAIIRGKARYYVCDVERTLFELKNKDGKFHLWD